MTVARDSIGRKIGKRRDNGPADNGISETSLYIRLPADLKAAMKARAKRDDVSESVTWRQAAEEYLARG